VTFRGPALLVKAVTTLDVLSGGRAWLGIGHAVVITSGPWTPAKIVMLNEAMRV
jgi:alkanesulfonate monooxygenase SsuD/methylene tetrahydromethanopterin reductase-like flavin-dependent oxidoreductase (luciferase family)